jgi:FAD dependent oxidoreductase TIGR03364
VLARPEKEAKIRYTSECIVFLATRRCELKMGEVIAVVGGGIFGIAHVWGAIKSGKRVIWVERDQVSQSGSVRNFGMIWPIGQPLGEPTELAVRSAAIWHEVAATTGCWFNRCGSLHLAHHEDEFAVLEEYAAACRREGLPRKLLSLTEIEELAPVANLAGLKGGLYSETEFGVNPPRAIRQLTRWLLEQQSVTSIFGVAALGVEEVSGGSLRVRLADKRTLEVDRVIICSGADVKTLFPEQLAGAALRICKLQMLKTVAQPAGWRCGPHVASGLTLRHYRAFDFCPSLRHLKQRIAADSPELDRFGIHVMCSQNESGEVILGDSHEYDSEIEPFDKQAINDLILRELRKVIRLPTWEIASTWHGVYAKYPEGLWWESEPIPGVHLRTGLGGNGMTLSFGVAERFFVSQ